ncbi:MAG: hypothetical protein JXQ66_07075 [Campylobacterales bacterium]|nr:hypothetical protein [Campylobacterales bacterium]
MSIKNIQIRTLTFSYDGVEDRIRLSINYQDLKTRIDMMITRSFIIRLLPTIEEYIYKHYPNENLEDEVHLEIPSDKESSSDNQEVISKSVKETNMEDLELYKSREDLLFTINLKYDKTSNLTVFEFISKNNYKAVTNCNVEFLKNIIKSLRTSIPKVSWGIGYL